MSDKKSKIEYEIVAALKQIYDPEIPVNIYDLGLIYKIEILDNFDVEIDMTLTAPNCPMADSLLEDVQSALKALKDVRAVNINIVFDPPWSKNMMSEEALLDLGWI